jgi:hypothetical protein
MARPKPCRVQDSLGQTIGMAQAGAEIAYLRAPAACLEEAAHLSRMVAGQRSAGIDKTPPKLPVIPAVDASSAAN